LQNKKPELGNEEILFCFYQPFHSGSLHCHSADNYEQIGTASRGHHWEDDP
jgi:hypothetical protein